MALTTVPDRSVGDVFTETMWDVYLRDNLNGHKSFAEGSAPFPGASQAFGNDANFALNYNSGNPLLQFDSTDFLLYARGGNEYGFYVGGAKKFSIDANGLIQTAAFTSAETTITAGSTANIAHGLGVAPRFFGAVYGTTTGLANCTKLVIPSFNSLGSFARMSDAGATNLVIVNGTAATIYVYAFALR